MQVAASLPRGAETNRSGTETVWLEFRERLRAFVSRRVSNPADVDDIVQWVFLQLHRNLGEIRNGERIHAWLYGTARRSIVDYYRSAPRRREVLAGGSLDLDALASSTDTSIDDDTNQEVASCLAPMVERLSAADRDAVVLTEIQGLRLADAAARAGISLSGMKSRVQRARRRLHTAMLECCHLALDGRGMPTSCVKRDKEKP